MTSRGWCSLCAWSVVGGVFTLTFAGSPELIAVASKIAFFGLGGAAAIGIVLFAFHAVREGLRHHSSAPRVPR
jgi:hypothetical protein